MERPLVRYAVIGLGHIAQHAVLPAFVHVRANSRLAALVSGDPVKLKRLGERYGVDVRGGYADLETCLAHADAVYICTPNSTHAEFAVRAAEAGKHVLCEKPLAVTDEECVRMIAACRANGVRLMTAYRLHFEGISLEILSRVRRGDIGEPRFFTSTFSMHVKPGGIRTRRSTGGGTLYDIGIYCINAARVLFGEEPTRVFAYSIAGDEVDDITAAVLQFSGNKLATFTASFASADVSSYLIVGTKGSIEAKPAYAYAEPLAYTVAIGDREQRKQGMKVDQFAAELNYFSECVLRGRDPEPSGEEGAWEVRIIDALYESARTGESIALRPVAPERRPTAAQAKAFPPAKPGALVHAESPHR
ncbi:MAG TPA: Gfo/Idh/MocA family oxidoreductase [Vicinamibacterales bacterium]|nr:Gfo/Idh/MocA family oxidoreductase [Vicinamibacterales bacterium]